MRSVSSEEHHYEIQITFIDYAQCWLSSYSIVCAETARNQSKRGHRKRWRLAQCLATLVSTSTSRTRRRDRSTRRTRGAARYQRFHSQRKKHTSRTLSKPFG